MKKLSKLFFIIVLLLSVTACGNDKHFENISYKEYHKLLESKETFVLEIMRTGCQHCESLRPKLEKIAEEYDIEIKVLNTAKLSDKDVDKLYAETGISGTPTIIFYTNGEEETVASRINGNLSLDKAINKFKASGFIEE